MLSRLLEGNNKRFFILLLVCLGITVITIAYRLINTNGVYDEIYLPTFSVVRNDDDKFNWSNVYRFKFQATSTGIYRPVDLQEPLQRHCELIHDHQLLIEIGRAFNVQRLRLEAMCSRVASDSRDCRKCVEFIVQHASIGALPEAVTEQKNWNRSYEEKQYTAKIPEMYIQRTNSSNQSVESVMCDGISMDARRKRFNTMRAWTEFAAKHQILWWIWFGSLLGAHRHEGIIPYDGDMDIAVLGSSEELIRKLATPREKIDHENLNVIVRPGKPCFTNPGDRLDCHDVRVKTLSDQCSFCSPLARAFVGQHHHLDVFLVHVETQLRSNGQVKGFGFIDEAVDGGIEERTSHPLDDLFPLTSCRFINLTVPCPRNSSNILKLHYGTNFLQALWKCDLQSGQWIHGSG